MRSETLGRGGTRDERICVVHLWNGWLRVVQEVRHHYLAPLIQQIFTPKTKVVPLYSRQRLA